jgi:hypothetical protein
MEVEVGATSTATEVVLLSSESVPMMVMTGIWRPGLVIMLFIIFIVVGDGAEFVCELIGVAATIAAPLSKTSAIVDEIFIVLEFLLDFEVQQRWLEVMYEFFGVAMDFSTGQKSQICSFACE